ncbi:hypothetical protein CYY_005795 [Polysphondylium violaceum]|uniref:Transmembrane protein n=1 Tax=Polysphondylium violaceum TaxID=133409 RepID=A0A8J4UYJ4_9MYCE|nr:hypothetical protein CYY_005795 [Polysphondylium violaceum]
MGFFSFLGSLIWFIIKTPFLLTWCLVKLVFHPISILVALIALYFYYTSLSAEKRDVPFVSKLAPSGFKPVSSTPINGTKGAKKLATGKK